MSQRIDQFREDLHLKVANIDSGLGALRANLEGKADLAEQQVRSHLDQVRTRIEQGRVKVTCPCRKPHPAWQSIENRPMIVRILVRPPRPRALRIAKISVDFVPQRHSPTTP